MMRPKVLVGVTGSVATIKLSLLIQQLQQFAEVQIVTTDAAQTFFKLEEVVGVKVWTDKEEWNSWKSRTDPVTHIELRRWADVFVIAPLSANTLAKLAYGLSDNLLTCVARAWDFKKPLLVAPAMNTFMWDHPHTAKHLKKIQRLGIHIIDPVAKKLACGDVGYGAMAEVGTIATAVATHFHTPLTTMATPPGTLMEVIEKHSGGQGDGQGKEQGKQKVAVAATDEEVELTYGELGGEIQQLTNTLVSSGVQKGDVIAIILPNGLPFLISFLATTWARAIAAPLNSAYTLDEFVFYLDDIKAKVVVLAPGPHAGRDAAQKLKIPIWEMTQDSKDKKVS